MKAEIVHNTKGEPRLLVTCETPEEAKLLNAGPALAPCVRELRYNPSALNEESEQEHLYACWKNDDGDDTGWLPVDGDYTLSWSYLFKEST